MQYTMSFRPAEEFCAVTVTQLQVTRTFGAQALACINNACAPQHNNDINQQLLLRGLVLKFKIWFINNHIHKLILADIEYVADYQKPRSYPDNTIHLL